MDIIIANNIGWQYFGLAMLLLFLIISVLAILIYSKWLMWGPKFKAKGRQIKEFLLFPFVKKELKQKKGEVFIDPKFKKELDEQIKNATTPQEILSAQKAKIKFDNEIALMQQNINEKQNNPKGFKNIIDKLFSKNDKEKNIQEDILIDDSKNQVDNSIDSLLSNTNSDIESKEDEKSDPTGEVEFEKTFEMNLSQVPSNEKIEDTEEVELNKTNSEKSDE